MSIKFEYDLHIDNNTMAISDTKYQNIFCNKTEENLTITLFAISPEANQST